LPACRVRLSRPPLGYPHVTPEPVDRLLADGHTVVASDNFSTGQRAFLTGALSPPRFTLVEGDTLDLPALTRAMAGCDNGLKRVIEMDMALPMRRTRASGR
jgi:UDP-glucose 4-epimerase